MRKLAALAMGIHPPVAPGQRRRDVLGRFVGGGPDPATAPDAELLRVAAFHEAAGSAAASAAELMRRAIAAGAPDDVVDAAAAALSAAVRAADEAIDRLISIQPVTIRGSTALLRVAHAAASAGIRSPRHWTLVRLAADALAAIAENGEP